MKLNKRLFTVILLYIIILFIIFLSKPAMIFDANGNIKQFSYEDNNTSSLLNMEVILCILAVFCYFIVIAFEMRFS